MRKRLIATPTRTAEIMHKYDLKMKKSLGQNFLVEPQILKKMMHIGDIDKNTTVIEIGPGIGALTEMLAIHAKNVIAFEIDHRFVNVLNHTLSEYDNVKIIESDILEINFEEETFSWLREVERLVVVANLPYYITTPIIMHLINSSLPFDALIMMMQREVAERMTAKVGMKGYNSLSIAIDLYMKSKLAFTVPSTVFIPRPRVESAVLKLQRRSQLKVPVEHPKRFETFVQTAFEQRRKTLWNNIRHSQVDWLLNQPEAQLKKGFFEAEIDPSVRAENLTIESFFKLYQSLNKNIVEM